MHFTDDYDLIDQSCPKCGNDTLHGRRCHEINCEDGFIDESDEDYMLPGTNMIACDTCKGTGYEVWCPACSADLSGIKLEDENEEYL